MMDAVKLAEAIDQTLLKPTIGVREARAWMTESRDQGFATLCVSPFLVPTAAEVVAGTTTAVCSVASFPLGYALPPVKACEATALAKNGCREVDMVINIAALLEGADDYVTADIRGVVEASRASGATVKVILETGYLDSDAIVRGCKLSVAAGAAFVKTSTGFGPRGASVEDVRIMRETVGPEVGVKAAGGIRDLETALAMIEAGANRIGSSAGIEIVAQARSAGM